MAKQIPLSGGKAFATVDDEDYDFLMQWKWQILKSGHAYRSQVISYDPSTRKHRKRSILMHREIMNAPAGMVVDHKNGDVQDNQRGNLRVCRQQDNTMNRRKQRENKSEFGSKYKGVRRARHNKTETWAACISINRKLTYIGRFNTETEAAQAYNAKALEHFGEFAHLNQIAE